MGWNLDVTSLNLRNNSIGAQGAERLRLSREAHIDEDDNEKPAYMDETKSCLELPRLA